MNIYILLAIIPVVLAVALIVALIRRNITENRGGGLDIAPAIPAIVVLMIAILVIVPMAQSTQDYLYDEGSGELVIQKNIPQLATQPWDEYADEVKSLVIKDGVSIGSGAFDSLTSLEYIKIGEDVTLGSNVLGVSIVDPFGSPATVSAGTEYAGTGNGTIYECDPSIFTVTSGAVSLAASASSAVNIVIPSSIDGETVTIAGSGFLGSGIQRVFVLDGIERVGYRAFKECTSLTNVVLADSVKTIAGEAFYGCTALTTISTPGVEAIEYATFAGASVLSAVDLPAIVSVGGQGFVGCPGITAVSFGSGLTTVSNNSFQNWTFYATDGTTVIDKTVAANLAGKAFQGTNTALVEITPGMLSLTPQQIQQVNLHTMEDQDLDIQPLPFQPTVQTQDQEPVSA